MRERSSSTTPPPIDVDEMLNRTRPARASRARTTRLSSRAYSSSRRTSRKRSVETGATSIRRMEPAGMLDRLPDRRRAAIGRRLRRRCGELRVRLGAHPRGLDRLREREEPVAVVVVLDLAEAFEVWAVVRHREVVER